MTFEQVYAQCKLVVEISETEKKRLESQENLCAYEICRISDLEKDIEFYSKIAEACEKQIAREPIYNPIFKIMMCECHARTLPGQRFCSYCGQKLSEEIDE